ncbi:hypothetical protein PT067_08770 [Erysipelothrix rhusiopathiae]|nr:hypothetical protein [Erysipelothrix rhusiopathiae]MDE8037304.1 hypothetical protein [Erysipelothrix rhusiopathiae]MDE8038679.1 hypothetical protein [Erysipelothrix rhusiopathiae]MDE8041118.1 hypothetical protein [Erysipelothrix rhusiopathiae]MDE8042796.1 hypothetical protein [Erysipelothrix rhusiopathiae]
MNKNKQVMKLGEISFSAGFFGFVALRIAHVFYAVDRGISGDSWNTFLQFKGLTMINLLSYALIVFSIVTFIYSLLYIVKE